MAISITTDLQNALNEPERYGFVMLTFVFGSNTYGLWTGPDAVSHGGILYRTGGSAIEASNVQQNTDGSVVELTLKLNTAPDKGLDVDILQTFYDEDWQFGHVTVQIGLRHPTTKAIISTVVLISGVILEAPLIEDRDGARIEARIVAETIKLSENGGLYRNAATQLALDADDTSMVGIGTLGGSIKKDMKWGQV